VASLGSSFLIKGQTGRRPYEDRLGDLPRRFRRSVLAQRDAARKSDTRLEPTETGPIAVSLFVAGSLALWKVVSRHPTPLAQRYTTYWTWQAK
jgi:hypothetical protein